MFTDARSRVGLGGVNHCSFRDGSKPENIDDATLARLSGTYVGEDVRYNNGGEDDNASSRLHFSEQYNSELFGIRICF